MWKGEAALGLSGVLAALAEREAATAEARRAVAIYEAKGDRPGAERAEAFLDDRQARASG